MEVILFLLLGYLIGSIPFGLLLTKFSGMGDIRDIGSGNIGATNVLRTGNKKLASLTLLLDMLKGSAIIFIYYFYTDHFMYDLGLYYGTFSILGHCFPIWLKFKGGKGVATALGVFLSAAPIAGLLICITWLISAYISRISSLSALIAVAVAPIYLYIFYTPYAAQVSILIVMIIWAKHHENIRRLLKGEEPKIGKKK